jgi:hypothetical protein
LQAQEALTMTSSDLTRRELLELTAATGARFSLFVLMGWSIGGHMSLQQAKL